MWRPFNVALIAASALLLYSTSEAMAQSNRTEGDCRPIVSSVVCNVTISYTGLDPAAEKRLNEFLSKKFLELEQTSQKSAIRLNELLDKKDREIAGSGNLLAQRIQEANDWAKKYQELEQRLATAEDDSEVSEKARSLIKAGEFERAGALLDQLIGKQEQRQDVLAANHFNRAELHSLKFEPHLAIPHYESAYRYRPQNFGYAFAYALALHKQFRLADAEVVYNSLVNRQPEVSTEAGKDGKARVLNNLAILYSDTQRPGEAEKAYDEALGIYRELAKRNPEVYRPVVAVTLNNLANLYRATQRPGEAEKAINEARNFQTR